MCVYKRNIKNLTLLIISRIPNLKSLLMQHRVSTSKGKKGSPEIYTISQGKRIQ